MQSAKATKAFGIGLTAFAVGLIGIALVDSFGGDTVSSRAEAAGRIASGAPSNGLIVPTDPIVLTEPGTSTDSNDPIVVTDSIVADPVVTDPVATDPVATDPVTDAIVSDPAATEDGSFVTAASSTTPGDASAAGAIPVRVGCQPLRLMPLGDSMTAYPQSYRGPLYRSLAAANVNVDFVGSVFYAPLGGGDPDGEGHGGFTIGPDTRLDDTGNKANIYDNVDKWIPAAQPDVIVLTIGTNDMAGGADTKKTAPARYAALIKKIQTLAPNAVLVLDDIPPSRWYDRGDPYQVAIDAVPKRLGTSKPNDSVFYAPTSDLLAKNGFNKLTDIQDDKTHFTPTGGEKFAAALLPTVTEAIAFAERTRKC